MDIGKHHPYPSQEEKGGERRTGVRLGLLSRFGFVPECRNSPVETLVAQGVQGLASLTQAILRAVMRSSVMGRDPADFWL